MPRHPPIALTTLNRSHCQCSSSSWPFQRTGNGPDYLLQPSLINNAIDVFDPVTLLELRRAAHLCQIFKTSFSRSNPVPRGQATVIRPFIRGNPKDTNNERSRATSFLPTSNPSPILGRLGLQRVHRERARTWVKPTPGSLQINLLFTILQNRHQAYRQVQTFISSKTRMFSTRINTKTLVELSGIEPLTPCLQSRCSPS